MFWVPAELEKGNQDRFLPMAPEFAQMLQSVPEHQRTGRVFKFLNRRGKEIQFGEDWATTIITRIGKTACVVVHTDSRSRKKKFASPHDLRRSFGTRWSYRVMPQVLKELMRHERIETTMKYYVGQQAKETADTIWAAFGNTSGNSSHQTGGIAKQKPAASRSRSEL